MLPPRRAAMPDGSRHPGAAPAPQVQDEAAVGGIVRDPIDVRDRSYEPTLAPLAPFRLPSEELMAVLRDPATPWGLPRSQGDEGTCGGQALAAMIDLERLRAGVAERYRVSARMIYECARLRAGGQVAEDGISLRDVIKSFYNYGVCREELWPYVAGDPEPGQLSIERARDARNLSLGAYYRLRPNLNTYHAALHETGAILVSAELHDGWRHDRVREAKGEVVPPRPGASRGALGLARHAFVIVGYTPQGFLVLNSWGPDWGGWAPEGAAPVPGVGLWRYDDWADTIMDGWVLRLGVGAAEAFDYSIGDQGLGFGGDAQVRATPVHAILGNFLHLDDGEFVRSGAYVSTRRTLDETNRLLTEDAKSEKPYRGVLLTFAGGLQGLREATEHVARWKRTVRDAGWYPFTVLWCVDYVEQARAILDGVFREAEAQAGGPGARLDRLVEEKAHGVGRALWRDIGCAAERAARAGGPLHDLVRAGAALARARPGFGVRIVAESEGAVAVAALLRAMQTEPFAAEAGPFFEMLQSVDLVAPPLTAAEHAALAMYLNAGWGPAHPERRIRLHLPKVHDEKRLAVPPYSRSYFELVARAFHRRGEDEALADGVAAVRRRTPKAVIAGKWEPWKSAPRTELVPIEWPKGAAPRAQGVICQPELLYRSDVGGRLKSVLARRIPSRRRAAAAT
jgi:hypothetical protein